MEETKKKLDFNAVTGLITIIIALFYGLMAYMLPRAVIGNPMAPSIYPLILAITLAILGMILFLKSDFRESIVSFKFLKMKATKKDITNWKMIVKTCIGSLMYAAFFDYLGYVIATFIFLQIILWIVNGKEKWKINTIIALLFSVGIYIIFSKFLGIYLPQMPYLYI